MTLGPAIKRLRAAAGWSQRGFAEQLEISASYLSLIESDRREPSISLLRQMAAELGTPAVVLFASALESPESGDSEQAKLLAQIVQQMVDVTGATIAQMSLGLRGKPPS